MLHGKPWKVANELSEAQRECFQVADILDTSAIVGVDATKNRLLSEMREATILHIGQFSLGMGPQFTPSQLDKLGE